MLSSIATCSIQSTVTRGTTYVLSPLEGKGKVGCRLSMVSAERACFVTPLCMTPDSVISTFCLSETFWPQSIRGK